MLDGSPTGICPVGVARSPCLSPEATLCPRDGAALDLQEGLRRSHKQHGRLPDPSTDPPPGVWLDPRSVSWCSAPLAAGSTAYLVRHQDLESARGPQAPWAQSRVPDAHLCPHGRLLLADTGSRDTWWVPWWASQRLFSCESHKAECDHEGSARCCLLPGGDKSRASGRSGTALGAGPREPLPAGGGGSNRTELGVSQRESMSAGPKRLLLPSPTVTTATMDSAAPRAPLNLKALSFTGFAPHSRYQDRERCLPGPQAQLPPNWSSRSVCQAPTHSVGSVRTDAGPRSVDEAEKDRGENKVSARFPNTSRFPLPHNHDQSLRPRVGSRTCSLFNRNVTRETFPLLEYSRIQHADVSRCRSGAMHTRASAPTPNAAAPTAAPGFRQFHRRHHCQQQRQRDGWGSDGHAHIGLVLWLS
ncbi:hypothetical protein H920_06731 [Fukomys damarensis]|uniref:Uncharacterized protein n=1 Tax=Fukomys damarensis TaxID=885580 RepID=A0A091DNJ4_FUKDA|nr:hypothetical protein H920_06731 [Fukomys damarensis]